MNKRSLQILLIEDDKQNALLIRKLLKEIKTFKFKVQEARSFAAAKEIIAENAFDVCLVDHNPGEDAALEFLREAVTGDFRAPVILLVDEHNCAFGAEAITEGAADFLIKEKTESAMLERSIRYALERRRAEENLERSARREQTLVENSINLVCTVNREGRFVSVNPAYIKVLGYQPEELIGRYFADFIAPEDLQRTIEAAAIVMSGGEFTEFENCCPHKDGTPVHLVWTSYWSESEQLMFATAHDISERKRIEEAIRQSEEKYRNILETIEEGYFETDLSGRLVFFNDALCALLGYSREELLGADYRQYVDEENTRKLHDLFVEVYQTDQSNHLSKWEIIRKNGERKIHESSLSLIKDKENKSVGFRGLVRDITGRTQAERDLQESQQLVRLMIDTLPQAIWWKDSQGIYKGANSFIARVAGFQSPEEMLGLSDYDMPWTREEAELYRSVDRRVMETGVAELDMIETQLQFDGREAVVTTNKIPLRNAEGEIVGVLGTFADITEQRRAVAALRESEYKLRTLLESMREGILQVDNEEKITFINDCFCEMVGYSSEELMGANWAQLLLDDRGHDFISQVNVRRRAGISDSYELRLRRKSGETLWAIVGGAPILDAENNVVGSMGVFTDITQRKIAEEQLLHDAFHDGLTGLANRTLFTDHLQKTIERTRRDPKEIFAVLFLDFDRFKSINDSLGHTEGDKLLRQIAQRLEISLRSGDLVARLGGDEFTILLNKLNDADDVLVIAERIQEKLQTPFEVGGGEMFISASIGIALSTIGYEKAEDMLRDADIAMYRAKARGRAQMQVFDPAMHESVSQQLRLETEMRQALERKEFLLYYQPIFKLETETLVGFEALVRWKHPTRGMIPPFEFIPAAEENNLILPLGKWILYESCRQMRRWQDKNPAVSHLTVSVNLSAKQFLQPDLAEQISAILEKTALSPRCLKLEITESYIMENTETAIETMSKLRSFGVELSLDDFGTGYSSLSYLHRLPVNYLKIDRSFVTRMIGNEENAEIVHTIIKLAQNLKMKVVAEGIETSEQLNQLKLLNCEFGQGYYFAKPLEAKTAEKFIKREYARKANFHRADDSGKQAMILEN